MPLRGRARQRAAETVVTAPDRAPTAARMHNGQCSAVSGDQISAERPAGEDGGAEEAKSLCPPRTESHEKVGAPLTVTIRAVSSRIAWQRFEKDVTDLIVAAVNKLRLPRFSSDVPVENSGK